MKIIRILDLESTGDAPPEHGIVEIGYTDLVATMTNLVGELCGWTVGHGMSSLVNPGRPIPPETASVHHIIDEDVRDAPTWDEVWPAYLCDQRIIAFAAYGAEFEQKWILPEMIRKRPWLDVFKVAARLWPEFANHKNQTVRYALNPIGLDRTLASPAHRAFPDAYVTAHTLKEAFHLATFDQMVEWSSLPVLLPRCRVGKYRNGGLGTPWEKVDDGMLEWILPREFDENTKYTCRYHLDVRKENDRREREEIEKARAQKRATLAPSSPESISEFAA